MPAAVQLVRTAGCALCTVLRHVQVCQCAARRLRCAACAVSLRFNEGKEANAAVAFLSFATIAIVASIGFGFITSHSQLHFAKRQMAVTLAGGAGTCAPAIDTALLCLCVT